MLAGSPPPHKLRVITTLSQLMSSQLLNPGHRGLGTAVFWKRVKHIFSQ